MRYISGGTFVLCNELKYMNRISSVEYGWGTYEEWKDVSKGRIILCQFDFANNSVNAQIISSFKSSDEEEVSFAGPCRVGYADREMIVIFDNGFYVSKDEQNPEEAYSGNDSSLLILRKNSSGSWGVSFGEFDYTPMINTWDPFGV